MQDKTSHWDSQKYSENSTMQYAQSMAMIEQYPFQGDEAILDIGCGDGKITYQIALRVPKGKVLGVDNSEDMIHFAQKTFSAQPNLSFQLEDAQSLRLTEQFDVVTSMFCLQWPANKLAAFKSLANSLKPGGHALLIMPNGYIAKARQQVAKMDKWQSYFAGYTDPSHHVDEQTYIDCAKAAGLTIDHSITEATRVYFASKAQLAGFISAITPHLSRLMTPALQANFIDDIIEIFFNKIPQATDGSCQIEIGLIKMRLTKL